MASSFRVLVVEDDPYQAKTLCHLLKLAGLEAESISPGADAIIATKTFDPNAVLVDVILRNHDGLEVIRKLRAAVADLNIVAHSGLCQRKDQRAALEAGANQFLMKPARIRDIIGALMARHTPAD